ncbi:MAG: hypothetical protein RMK80_01725 [Pseudobdellovibrionaceae bacterium]|nr:hypothetical protein [Pseudobdellovibrionaceae bacterium]
MKNILLILGILLILCGNGVAQEEEENQENVDPFSDYSEYEQSAEEEADIYFFRYGRMISAHLQLGYRGFTDVLKELYMPSASYGLNLTYFFDIRLAMYLSFLVSDHEFILSTDNGTTTGNLSFTFLSIGIKNYFNTELLVWPLSEINPYYFVGFNQSNRTLTLSELSDIPAKDSTLGLEFGFGVELPLWNNRSYLGLQACYRYFNFIDENQFLIDPNSLTAIPVKPAGDSFDVLILLGTSF